MRSPWDCIGRTLYKSGRDAEDGSQDAEYETRPCQLEFSQHKGKTLDEVPGFVDWLVKKRLHLERTCLTIAVDEHRNAQRPKVQTVTSSSTNGP